MADKDPQTSPRLLAGKIMKKYFPEATSCMIIGSNAGREIYDTATDLDLIIIAPVGYNSGVQNFPVMDTRADITILPRWNFELILLHELFSGRHTSSLLYAMESGEIIADSDGKMAGYQALAQTFQREKHNLFSFDPETFVEYALSAKKYLDDYTRKTDVLESFFVRNKLVEVIVDMEMMINAGWTYNGKIKGRFLKALNPTMADHLTALLATENDALLKQSLIEWAAHYITGYQSLIKAYVPKYQRQLFQEDRLMLRFADRAAFEDCFARICALLNSDKQLRDIDVYVLYMPFRVLNTYHFHIVLKGDPRLVEELLLPRLSQITGRFQYGQPGYQALLQQFFGGAEAMNACERLWAFLCRERYSETGLIATTNTNAILLHILLLTGIASGYSRKIMLAFMEYLSECWMAYAATVPGQPYLEQMGSLKVTHQQFKAQLTGQASAIAAYRVSFTDQWPAFTAEEPWQKRLQEEAERLCSSLGAITVTLPACEETVLQQYGYAEMTLWPVHRRQLEMVFSIFDMGERNWAFLVAFVSEVIRNDWLPEAGNQS